MPDPLLLSLLAVAVAIGWWLGRRTGRDTETSREPSTLARDYFTGLNYLLNDQQDRAIETFVAALEVNSETIETHLTLGNLFRTRGEADRAVKVHQNLLARPALTLDQSDRVQLELSRDFLVLGLLDRAERLLRALLKDARDEEIRFSARRLLADLLEREKEWQQALEVAMPHLVRQDEETRRAAAHWLCELAEQERAEASPGLARKHLRQALATDERCVRANLLLAGLEHDTGHYRQEIRLLRRIPDQDPAFTPTLLEPLARAYRLLDDEAGLIDALRELLDRAPYTSLIIALAEALREREGPEAAIEVVGDALAREPSLGALDYLLALYQHRQGGDDEALGLLRRHTRAMLEAVPRHRCRRCGFTAEGLHWQCPRCRSWGTTKPILGLEGE